MGEECFELSRALCSANILRQQNKVPKLLKTLITHEYFEEFEGEIGLTRGVPADHHDREVCDRGKRRSRRIDELLGTGGC